MYSNLKATQAGGNVSGMCLGKRLQSEKFVLVQSHRFHQGDDCFPWQGASHRRQQLTPATAAQLSASPCLGLDDFCKAP